MARLPSGNDRKHAILDVADPGDLLRPFHLTDVNQLLCRLRHRFGKASVHGVACDAHGPVKGQPRIFYSLAQDNAAREL